MRFALFSIWFCKSVRLRFPKTSWQILFPVKPLLSLLFIALFRPPTLRPLSFALLYECYLSIVANTFTASRANEERINIFWMATYWLYYFLYVLSHIAHQLGGVWCCGWRWSICSWRTCKIFKKKFNRLLIEQCKRWNGWKKSVFEMKWNKC